MLANYLFKLQEHAQYIIQATVLNYVAGHSKVKLQVTTCLKISGNSRTSEQGGLLMV